jgi:hypothetical protein
MYVIHAGKTQSTGPRKTPCLETCSRTSSTVGGSAGLSVGSRRCLTSSNEIFHSIILSNAYRLVIAAKEPWRLGNNISTREALVATGKEAFRRLGESAGAYGVLLDLLKAHKWIDVKLATDDGFRAAFKLNTEKRGIDVLREAFGQNGEILRSSSHMPRTDRGEALWLWRAS